MEEAALQWFGELGYAYAFGPDLLPDGPTPERDERKVHLERRLRSALERLNPALPASAVEDAFRKLALVGGPLLLGSNRALHRMLVDGVAVEYQSENGTTAGGLVRVLDFDGVDDNDWLVVNQLTVIDGECHRRPDVVVYVNGLPLAVLELKNPADADADWVSAHKQLQTYKQEIPSLLTYDDALVASDGMLARIGTLTAGREWFLPWRTIDGVDIEPGGAPQLETLIKGAFDKHRFLDLIRYFIVFEDPGTGVPAKKMAGYHQFHAVNAALEETLRASGHEPDLVLAAETRAEWGRDSGGEIGDRLFGTFARCTELLGEPPVQAADRAHLRRLLARKAGGVVFTTVQKFLPDTVTRTRSSRRAAISS